MPSPDSPEPRVSRAAGFGDGVVVLELAGELDLAIVGRLRRLVDEVTAERPRLVVADLASVGFMDSSVLRELLRAHREVQQGGGRLVVTAVQPTVRRLFELTASDDVLDLADSREAALRATGP